MKHCAMMLSIVDCRNGENGLGAGIGPSKAQTEDESTRFLLNWQKCRMKAADQKKKRGGNLEKRRKKVH